MAVVWWALDVPLNPRKGKRDGGQERREGERRRRQQQYIREQDNPRRHYVLYLCVYCFKLLGMRGPRILLKWADETKPF